MKGAKDQPEIAEISDEGALLLYDRISQIIETGGEDLNINELDGRIREVVGNMLMNTNDIKIYDEDPNIVEARVVDDPLTVDDLDTVESKVDRKTRGIKPDVRFQLKKNYIDYGNLDNYLKLFAKFDNESLDDIQSSSDYNTLRLLYKDAGKFVLRDKLVALSQTISRMNNIIKDVLGTANYDNYAENLEQFQSIQSLTGSRIAKPRKRFRREAKEVREAEAMEEEDPRNISKVERRKELEEKKEKRREKKELSMMKEEDKRRPDLRRREARERIKLEGLEDSPLRQKGRRIMREKEEAKQGGASK